MKFFRLFYILVLSFFLFSPVFAEDSPMNDSSLQWDSYPGRSQLYELMHSMKGHYPKDTEILTKKALVFGCWSVPNIVFEEIYFFADDVFIIYLMHHDIVVKGTYSIESDRYVRLFIEEEKQAWESLMFPDGEAVFEFRNGNRLINESDSLVPVSNIANRPNYRFTSYSSLSQIGDIYIRDGIEVVKIMEYATVVDDVVFRTGPDISYPSKEVNYYYGHEFYGQGLHYFTKGFQFALLAKSVERHQIGDWNNFWYYVSYSYDEFEDDSGWVYGEFLDF